MAYAAWDRAMDACKGWYGRSEQRSNTNMTVNVTLTRDGETRIAVMRTADNLKPCAHIKWGTGAKWTICKVEFTTQDGYTLRRDGTGTFWTDGDMIFDDHNGRPVDVSGDPLK